MLSPLRRLRLARAIFASHYNQPATGLWRVFEAEVVRESLRGAGRGLDLGCGDGTLARVLFAETTGVRWTGLDLSAEDAARARESGVYDRVHTAPASAVPEPGGAFDLVFANSALEHMDDLDGVIAEAARVLRRGGRFVATVPIEPMRALLLGARALHAAGADGAAGRYVRHIEARLRHVNVLSIDAWRSLLAAHGLTVTAARQYLPARALATWEVTSNATGGLAWWVAGGARSPRDLQAAMGILRGESRALGNAACAVMAPALLFASTGDDAVGACAYIEARRDG